MNEAGWELGDGPGDKQERVEVLPEGVKRSHEDAVRPNAGLVGDEQHLLERVGKALGSQGRLAAARTRAEVAREFGLFLGADNFQTYVPERGMKVLTGTGGVGARMTISTRRKPASARGVLVGREQFLLGYRRLAA